MNGNVGVVVVAAVALLLVLGGNVLLVAKCWKRVPQGQALIVDKGRSGPAVSFTGLIVFPIVQSAEWLDLTARTFIIDRQGREALSTRDNRRVSARLRFTMLVRPEQESVMKVARSFGCARANDPKEIERHFAPEFLASMKRVIAHMTADDLRDPDKFEDLLFREIGADLNGFSLDTIVVEELAVAQAA